MLHTISDFVLVCVLRLFHSEMYPSLSSYILFKTLLKRFNNSFSGFENFTKKKKKKLQFTYVFNKTLFLDLFSLFILIENKYTRKSLLSRFQSTSCLDRATVATSVLNVRTPQVPPFWLFSSLLCFPNKLKRQYFIDCLRVYL